MSINATAVFCEDIRQEIGPQFTIIGILSDNLLVPSIPGMLPKLAIYVRVSLSVDHFPENFEVYLCHEKSCNLIGGFDKDAVATTISDTKASGNPIASFIMTAVASPFHVQQPGLHYVELRYGSDVTKIACLRIALAE